MKHFHLLFLILLVFSCKSSKTNTGPSHPIYSEGQIVIRGTLAYDFDLGKELTIDELGNADIFWRISTQIARYFDPMNNAEFSNMGKISFKSVDYSDLINLVYHSNSINGSDNNENQIPPGTVVAYVTNEGRYGKLIIDEYGYDLTVRWVTYTLSD